MVILYRYPAGVRFVLLSPLPWIVFARIGRGKDYSFLLIKQSFFAPPPPFWLIFKAVESASASSFLPPPMEGVPCHYRFLLFHASSRHCPRFVCDHNTVAASLQKRCCTCMFLSHGMFGMLL